VQASRSPGLRSKDDPQPSDGVVVRGYLERFVTASGNWAIKLGLPLADAVTLALDLKHGAAMSGWDWTGWFVAIIDARGHKVDEVPIL
jgi:hypothetical protein